MGLGLDWSVIGLCYMSLVYLTTVAESMVQDLGLIDPAYSNAFGIIGPYIHAGGRHALSADEYQFNVASSSVRIAVEHSFGHVAQQWGFTICKRRART
jgi:hypothetical protein